jgi:hypothetical protein
MTSGFISRSSFTTANTHWYEGEASHPTIRASRWLPLIKNTRNALHAVFKYLFHINNVQFLHIRKSSIFGDITPGSSLKFNGRVGGRYRLYLQGEISQARYQCKSSASHHLSRWYLVRLTLGTWRWKLYVSPKLRLICNGPHGVIPRI